MSLERAMNCAVCTLFEGDYHHGLAALANSLVKAGFRGTLYAGFRGERPAWSAAATALAAKEGAASWTLPIGPTLTIVFVTLSTSSHLSNHKPDFMLSLMDGMARDSDALFYLDADICVWAQWRYFEEWVSCGVALCEDVNSPLHANHPRRIGWRRFYAAHGLTLTYRVSEYVNGGCVGVRAADRDFLETWRRAMQLMADEIGSLSASKLLGGHDFRSKGFADCFDCSDQDGLNAAIEASTCAVSIIGQEAMGFKPGPALLPHALGSAKPWRLNYLKTALKGFPPRLADKAFWLNVQTPIPVYPAWLRAMKRADLLAAAFVGRLMRRA